jgi:hypothetical protein
LDLVILLLNGDFPRIFLFQFFSNIFYIFSKSTP